MDNAILHSNIARLLKKIEKKLYQNMFLPALGLIPLAYVFYKGFFDLPPILNTLVVFISLFLGLSLLLHWRGRFFSFPLMVVYLGLFFLPLTWLWRGLEFDINVMMGIFPFNDGMYYLVDAYRLINGLGTMVLQNGRPIYPGMLAFFMWLFDLNLQIALAVFCAFTAFAIFLLTLEIREISGPFSAALSTTLLFYFSLPYIGRVHTESLGLTFGALGLALLLRGARKVNIPALAFGALAFSMGLNARAGAFFVLPFLLYWAWKKREIFGLELLFILLGSISIGFLVNSYLMKEFAIEGRTTFSNFGLSLYGLAAGYKGWGYIFTVHPEYSNYSNIFSLAFELALKNPLMLFWGILLSYKDYFSPNGMFYLMRFGNQQIWISWILYLAMFVGSFRLIKLRHEMYWSLVIYITFGILLSMAMLPHNDDGLRVLMTTNPVNILVVSLALGSIQESPIKEQRDIRAKVLIAFVGLLTLASMVGPLIVTKYHRNIPPLANLNCPEGTEQVSLFVTPGSYLNIINDGPTFGFLPEVKKADIKTRLDDYYIRGEVPFDVLTNFPAFENLVKKLRPGDTFLIGLNLINLYEDYGPDKFIFLITRTKQIEHIGEVNDFCARLPLDDRLRSNLFYFDQSVELSDYGQ